MINIVSGPAPYIISRKDLDNVRLKYQKFYKCIESPEYRYSKNLEMQNYLRVLVFSKYIF